MKKCMGRLVYVCVLLTMLCGSAALAATETAPAGTVMDWGDNVRLTTTLMEGQQFGAYFSGKLLVRDAVAAWAKQLAKLPASVQSPRREAAILGLGALNALFSAHPEIKWSVRDLYTTAWDKLPFNGNPEVKTTLHRAFADLKNNAKMMVLTFVDRPVDHAPPPGVAAALDAFIKNPLFESMDLAGLYNTPADPNIYDDAALTTVIDVTDGLKILRSEALEIVVVNEQGQPLPLLTATTACCVRTTRICAPVGSYPCCCKMCTPYCCLGSSWC